jgi:hypothetical protein
VDYTGRWKLLQHAMARIYAPVVLIIHSGWDTPENTGWNDTNITTGIANDTPQSAVATVTMTLRSWTTGEALQSWNSTGTVSAFSSRNFTKAHKSAILGNHESSAVFLTATATIHPVVAVDDKAGVDNHGSHDAKIAPPQAVHFFTKMKMAELHDPQIKLVFGGGDGSKLIVTASCAAPAPNVFVDPGALLGHFDDNGMLLLPGHPKTLYFDPMGEANVTVERLRKEVVARSPWSTQHPSSQ